NPTAAANKAALLRNLSRVRSTGGTPLRQGLEDVGQYFQGTTSGNWQTALFGGSPNHDINETVSALSPIFNDANGGNCQQHFTILMSDGFWNGAAPTRGNADGDGDTAFDGPPYADTGSNTLGDVAMYYYERDLRGDLANDVPTVTGVDENDAQHMVTFTVAFGLEGTLDPFDTKTPGDPTDTDPNDAGFIGWPIPPAAGNDPTTLDDMFHAAFNGRGLFLSAKKPGQVQTALQAALDTAIARTASASAVGLNSGSLDANSRLYQARFNSGNWTGQLLAFDIDQNTGAIITPELWDAGVELNAKVDVDTDLDGDNDGWTDRTIITFDGAAGIPFRWTNIVTAGMDGDLNKDGQGIPDSLGQEQGQQRLQYLRGSDEHEGRGNNYRVRAGILGDIVNAAPVFVGKPAFNYPDNLEASGETYSTFRSNNTPPSRTPMVYVGANDGMVHGFNADTGEELIGYVPKKVLPNLTRLTALNYSHRFYVDGPPTVGDVFFGTTWHTVLVGGLRNGGQGIYALDVTNPAPTNFSEANASGLVLWEFTDANDADLGFTYSRPAIVRMHNDRWAAVFGNGYNNTVADGNASITGHAVLYIVDVENGTLIRKIDTLAGSTTTPNGLPTVSPVDVDGDRTVDLIYAGDLEGNLWKFNVTNSDPANWGIAFGGSPLFVATDDGGVPQPITTRPEVGLHPKADRDGFIVYFGTGKYLESSDNDTASAQTQTFYGIWDPNKLTAPGYSRTTNLLRQDITNEIQVDATTEARITTDNQITWAADPLGLQAGEHLGWYMDLINVGATPLDNRGERQVTTPVLRGDRIIFTTLIPAGSPCLFGGDGFLMELDTNDGSRLSGAPFDFDEDGVFDLVDVGGGTFVVPSGVRSTAGAPSSPGILDAGDGKEYKYISGTDQAAIQVIHEASNPQGPPSGTRESWRQLQ
ncbi:MAG: pilus assembly protein, partial [Alphaproteobacteria bacterium]